MIAGLHCAHILFYNRVLSELGSMQPVPRSRAARAARGRLARDARYLLQYLIARAGDALALPVAAGQRAPAADRRAGRWSATCSPAATSSTCRRRGDAFMPIEFGAAAYRFGHSMVRPSYRANFTSGTGDSANPTADPFFGLVFDATEPDFNGPVSYDRDDLLGGYPAPRRYVGWQTFFDLGDGQVKNNKKIDTTISSVLFTLPAAGHRAAHPDRAHRAAAAQPAPPAHLEPAVGPGRRPGHGRRPAHRRRPGRHRRGVRAVRHQHAAVVLHPGRSQDRGGRPQPRPGGGRIVAETLIGLLRADPTSYLSVYPRFTPFLGTDLPLGPTPDTSITGNRSYTRAHFLYYAGVVAARHLPLTLPGRLRLSPADRLPAAIGPGSKPSATTPGHRFACRGLVVRRSRVPGLCLAGEVAGRGGRAGHRGIRVREELGGRRGRLSA